METWKCHRPSKPEKTEFNCLKHIICQDFLFILNYSRISSHHKKHKILLPSDGSYLAGDNCITKKSLIPPILILKNPPYKYKTRESLSLHCMSSSEEWNEETFDSVFGPTRPPFTNFKCKASLQDTSCHNGKCLPGTHLPWGDLDQPQIRWPQCPLQSDSSLSKLIQTGS